ncbi:MAG: aminoacetone oxidase family FAD-binding enzyme, partial [Lachnospiraceae bacterium]|nr:aminoacetone oxidase family FAD-binding enzyme [Lachnospiraceae bacterium]
VVLSASSIIIKYLKKGNLTIKIDLKPALTEEQLDARILRDFEDNINRDFKNSLSGLLPKKMIPSIIRYSGIPEDKKINNITREERRSLVKALKGFTLTIEGLRGYDEAIITQGGVNVKEINPATMESKLVKGLYFAGEMIDIDAFTGGYNLQLAWSTGYLAGNSIE